MKDFSGNVSGNDILPGLIFSVRLFQAQILYFVRTGAQWLSELNTELPF